MNKPDWRFIAILNFLAALSLGVIIYGHVFEWGPEILVIGIYSGVLFSGIGFGAILSFLIFFPIMKKIGLFPPDPEPVELTDKEFLAGVIEILEEGILDPDCGKRDMDWRTYIDIARLPKAEPPGGWHIDTGRAVSGIPYSWVETYRRAFALKEHCDEAS